MQIYDGEEAWEELDVRISMTVSIIRGSANIVSIRSATTVKQEEEEEETTK